MSASGHQLPRRSKLNNRACRLRPKSGQTGRRFTKSALCHEPTYAVQQDLGSNLVRGLAVAASGQANREHRALTRFARHGHVAAHHARELAGDGKAETRAAEALSGRSVGLAELLEQLCLLLRGHANAGIGDGELDEAAAIAHPACRKPDLARALVNLQALLNRLSRICRSRIGSTVNAPRFSWASTTRRFLFCSASCPAVLMTSLISG